MQVCLVFHRKLRVYKLLQRLLFALQLPARIKGKLTEFDAWIMQIKHIRRRSLLSRTLSAF